MSWETTHHSEKCFCGKGTITWTSRSGDWNGQFESTPPVLHCPECEKIFSYEKVGVYSENHEPRMGWVKRKKRRRRAKSSNTERH
jgi:hypothetical protein